VSAVLLVTGCTTESSSQQTTTSGGRVSSEAATTGPEVTVTSSLEGQTVLPRLIPWSVSTSLPAGQVREVRFLVDDKLRWVDREPPYTYAGDGGYLVAPSLVRYATRGDSHSFTAQVVALDGSESSATVDAGVPVVHSGRLPHGMFGRLTAEAMTKPFPERLGLHSAEIYLTGDSELWLGQIQNAYRFAVEGGRRTIRILAPIRALPPGESYTISGWRFGSDLCGQPSPSASYAVSDAEIDESDALRLTARRDPCARRRALLEGLWERLD
jgi:hypothetical protein